MGLPFMLGKGEELIKESSVNYWVGEIGSGGGSNVGRLFLTNQRLAVCHYELLLGYKLIAIIPFKTLISVELQVKSLLMIKAWGFWVSFQTPQGEIVGFRFYTRGAAEKWARDWVDTIQRAIEATESIETDSPSIPNINVISSSNLDELEKLAALRDKGIITEEEFEAKKKQLLGL